MPEHVDVQAKPLDYRTFKKWADDGLLGKVKFSGSGVAVAVTDEQAHLAAALVRLRRSGLDYKTLKRVARKLRQGDWTCPLCGGDLHA
jgi:hypothetical protein